MLYVDHMRHPFGRMLMNHLMADTQAELEQAIIDLGLPPGIIQHRGEPKEHLDVSESKRALALRLGAKPITGRELVEIVRRRREDDDRKKVNS